jgi:hypothetical protein
MKLLVPAVLRRSACQTASLGVTAATLLGLFPEVIQARPNGTWLSKPQIDFHLSSNTLDPAMQRIRAQQYQFVFLDFRNISEQDQQTVANTARKYQLSPIVWIQSPQYRQLSIPQLIHEARNADGLQVDDHFFSHYSQSSFYQLRANYPKRIFCSIQPFQAKVVPRSGCDQLDVQCYTPETFETCVGLADRLRAVTSLSSTNTLGYYNRLGGRWFNVFLWPHTNEFVSIQPPPQSNPNQTVVGRPLP